MEIYMTTPQVLQLAATVLLAATLGADILAFIYLTSRDGYAYVMRHLPAHLVPRGPYEQVMYYLTAVIVVWELVGSIFSLTRPSTLLGILIIFVIVATILVALKQYDDAQEKILDTTHTLVIIAIPVPPGSSSQAIVDWIIEIAKRYPNHIPHHIVVVEKNVTEIKDQLGINIVADPKPVTEN
jgi:hypothetical protein